MSNSPTISRPFSYIALSSSRMASSFNTKTLFFLVFLLSFTVFCFKSDDEEDYDPAQIVARALDCFSDNYIYKSCDESFRLSQSGNINVSPEETDQFCNGPCLEESNLVLNCINSIFSHFFFYNRATVKDIRDTFKAGCSYTSERGNFDVSQHLESHAWKVGHAHNTYLLITLGCYLLFWNHY